MTRRAWPLLLLAVLALPPPASAQSPLMDALTAVHFAEITFTASAARIDVSGVDMQIRGDNASDLRRCIDGRDCPDSTVGSLSNGDGNGVVSRQEVDDFAQALRDVIGLNQQAKDFKNQIRGLVKIDGREASRVDFDAFRFRDAERAVSSADPIYLTITLFGEFPSGDEKTHRVEIERAAETTLDIADRVVVQAARGWGIQSETITPATLAGKYQDGKILGSQDDFEGTEPLAFQIEKKGGGAIWWILVPSLLALLLAIGAYVMWRRSKNP